MDATITTLKGLSYRLSDHDVVVQDIIVGSMPVIGNYGEDEGYSGTLDYGANYGQRVIKLSFFIRSNDSHDYAILRDFLHKITVSREPYYIRELRSPDFGSLFNSSGDIVNDDLYVGGKRYKVRVSGEYDLDQIMRYGFGEITFVTVDSPYAESVKKSMDIDRNGLKYGDGWGYGMGLSFGEGDLKYSGRSGDNRKFSIFNPSDIDLHPFEHEIKITLTKIVRDTFEIKNVTTGEVLKLRKFMDATDKFVIDGANMTVNGKQIIRETNRQYITLAKGWNDFELTRTADFEFDFRFYYK